MADIGLASPPKPVRPGRLNPGTGNEDSSVEDALDRHAVGLGLGKRDSDDAGYSPSDQLLPTPSTADRHDGAAGGHSTGGHSRRGSLQRTSTMQAVEDMLEDIHHEEENTDMTNAASVKLRLEHEEARFKELMTQEIHKEHGLARDRKYLFYALMFLCTILITQIMSTYYLFSRLNITFNDKGELVSFSGKPISVKSSDLSVNSAGVLTQNSDSAPSPTPSTSQNRRRLMEIDIFGIAAQPPPPAPAPGAKGPGPIQQQQQQQRQQQLPPKPPATLSTARAFKKAPLNSLLSDETLKQLKVVHIHQNQGNATSNFRVDGVHRTAGNGRFGSVVTLQVGGGDLTIDGNLYFASQPVLASLKNSKQVNSTQNNPNPSSTTASPQMWARLDNCSIIGEFNVNSDADLALLPAPITEQKKDLPRNFNVLVKRFEECPSEQVWQRTWCVSSNQTVKHPDFPGKLFFKSTVLLAKTADDISYQKTTNAMGPSIDQSTFLRVDKSSGNVISWVEARGGKTGDCRQLDGVPPEALPENIFASLADEIPSFIPGTYMVNGKPASKFILKLFDSDRVGYRIIEWYQAKSSGQEVVRIFVSSFKGGEGSKFASTTFFMDPAPVYDLREDRTAVTWWPNYADVSDCIALSLSSDTNNTLAPLDYRPPLTPGEASALIDPVPAIENVTMTVARRRLSEGRTLETDWHLKDEHNEDFIEHQAAYERWLADGGLEAHTARRLEFEAQNNISWHEASEDQRRSLQSSCYMIDTKTLSSNSFFKKYIPIPRMVFSYNCKTTSANAILKFSIDSFDTTLLLGGISLMPSLAAKGGGSAEIKWDKSASANAWLSISMQGLPSTLRNTCRNLGGGSYCTLSIPLGTASLSASPSKNFNAGRKSYSSSVIGINLSADYALGWFSVQPRILLEYFGNKFAHISASAQLNAGFGAKYTLNIVDSYFQVDM